jgi:hypothetical protein
LDLAKSAANSPIEANQDRYRDRLYPGHSTFTACSIAVADAGPAFHPSP